MKQKREPAMKTVHITMERWTMLRSIAKELEAQRGANVSVQELVALAVDKYIKGDQA